MEGELKSLMMVNLSIIASLCYYNFIVSKIPKGKLRIRFLLPIFSIFSPFLSFAHPSFSPTSPTVHIMTRHFQTIPLCIWFRPSRRWPAEVSGRLHRHCLSPHQIQSYKPLELPMNFVLEVLGSEIFMGLYEYKRAVTSHYLLGRTLWRSFFCFLVLA